MYRLAESNFRGRGVSRNPTLAVIWLERSHEAGNPRATDVLATCYAVGNWSKEIILGPLSSTGKRYAGETGNRSGTLGFSI